MPETMSDSPRPHRLLPDCEEIHHLTMKAMDRPLGWTERVRMRGHLLVCAACTRFNAQMRLMRSAMHRMGQDDDEPPGSRR